MLSRGVLTRQFRPVPVLRQNNLLCHSRVRGGASYNLQQGMVVFEDGDGRHISPLDGQFFFA